MIVFIGIALLLLVFILLSKSIKKAKLEELKDRKENPEKWKRIDEERKIIEQKRDVAYQIKAIERDLVKSKKEVEELKGLIDWEQNRVRKKTIIMRRY